MIELYLFEGFSETYGFTPRITQKIYEGVTYEPTIIKRSNIKLENNSNKNEVTFTFPKNHFYAQELVAEIPETPILVTIYRSEDGVIYDTYWTGRVISTEIKKITTDIKCDSLYSTLKRSFLAPKASVICWAALYSEQCGVDKNLWGSEHYVVATSTEVLVSGMDKPVGYYNNGLAILNGQQRRIIHNTLSHIYLASPYTRDYTGNIMLYPGCGLTETSCAGFNNLLNHKGFKNMPWKNPYGNTGLL